MGSIGGRSGSNFTMHILLTHGIRARPITEEVVGGADPGFVVQRRDAACVPARPRHRRPNPGLRPA